jgi:DNA invertase Pin-like site-specific DNA recombinase
MQQGSNFIAYSRCSTEEQRTKGNSHEYQIDGIRRSGAVRVGKLQAVGTYSDTVSGTRFDNREAGLDAAFTLCDRQRGRVAYLFVYRWDRFGRSVEYCFTAIRRFREIGVEVNCPDEWIDYTDPSWPLILSVKFGMAQSESMRISDRTRDGVHAAKLTGLHTAHAPVGYLKGEPRPVNGKPRRVCEVVPELAYIIRHCFERYAAGESKMELFRKHGAQLGVKRSQFARMLSNPFYCGLVLVKPFRGNTAQIIEGLHAPIITRELFDACQRRQAESEHPTKNKTWSQQADAAGVFYLKGILKDERGRNMTAYRSRGRHGGRFPYYGRQGGGLTIPAGKAHSIVGRAMSAFQITPDAMQEVREEINRQLSERKQKATRAASAAVAGIQTASKRLDNIRRDYADGVLAPNDYRDMKGQFEADQVRHEAELIQAQRDQEGNEGLFLSVLNLLADIETLFSASEPEYKNRLLRAFFPDGFQLDLEQHRLRTPCINEIISYICTESTLYDVVEIEKGPGETARPSKGAEAERYRTHLEALQSLFAA